MEKSISSINLNNPNTDDQSGVQSSTPNTQILANMANSFDPGTAEENIKKAMEGVQTTEDNNTPEQRTEQAQYEKLSNQATEFIDQLHIDDADTAERLVRGANLDTFLSLDAKSRQHLSEILYTVAPTYDRTDWYKESGYDRYSINTQARDRTNTNNDQRARLIKLARKLTPDSGPWTEESASWHSSEEFKHSLPQANHAQKSYNEMSKEMDKRNAALKEIRKIAHEQQKLNIIDPNDLKKYHEYAKAQEKIAVWVNAGKQLTYPELYDDWEKVVKTEYDREDFDHNDIERVLKVMQMLDRGESFEKVYPEMYYKTDYNTILKFSKRGPEFATYCIKGEEERIRRQNEPFPTYYFGNPHENYKEIAQIKQRNQRFEANEVKQDL